MFPVKARPTPLFLRAKRRFRRAKPASPATWAAAVAVVVLLGGALGVLPQITQIVRDEQVSAAAASDIPPAYLAAYQQAGSSVNPPVPWEILAGIGKVTTDHGQRSPYDDTDRTTAPASDYPDVTPPIVSRPSAARADRAAAPGIGATPDGELSTDQNNVPVFLAGERQVESGGNYAVSAGGASGAYGYIDTTWSAEARLAGYAHYASGPAAGAPAPIQDDVAGYQAQRLFADFHNWYWVAEAWYFPQWAGDAAHQDNVPFPGAGNTLTMAGYARKVLMAMAASTGVAAGGPPVASAPTITGTGPLLLTAPATTVPGADLQDIDTEADLLAGTIASLGERIHQQLGLPSGIFYEPLSDAGAQRFWTEVITALPVAPGVGIDRLVPPSAAVPASRDGTVHAGLDGQGPADALTMAEFYAGVIADPTPASGRSYAPSDVVPAGYTIAAGTPHPAVAAITMALGQLGKPYVYGAAGPAAYDCSGLVMAAYASAGIQLPRTTYSQYLIGQAVPVGDPGGFAPGDLLFVMGSDPLGAAPGHVGMFIGDGQVIDAPYTGASVHISPLSSWTPKLVSVRRVVAAAAPLAPSPG